MPEAEGKENFIIPHAEAGLLRLYWLSQKAGEEPKLSLRSFLSCVAGSLLYKAGSVDNLVLCIGPEWGKNYPTVSVMAAKVLQTMGVPVEHVKVFSDALDSEQETRDFLKYAKENHFTKLVDIGFSKHEKSRRRGYTKQGSKPEPFVSIEQVINTMAQFSLLGSGHQKLLNELKNSKYELAYALYEGGKNTLYKLNLDNLLTKGASKRGEAPSSVTPLYKLLGFDMDAFYLPNSKL